nr:hypothetical protein [Bradyrhizobium sp. CCBAU 53338]
MPSVFRSGVFSDADGRGCSQLKETSNDPCRADPCGEHKRGDFVSRAVNLSAMLDKRSHKDLTSGLNGKHQRI